MDNHHRRKKKTSIIKKPAWIPAPGKTSKLKKSVSFPDNLNDAENYRPLHKSNSSKTLFIDREELCGRIFKLESDGRQISSQISILKNRLQHLREENHDSQHEASHLVDQCRRLSTQLEDFHLTNINLQDYLREFERRELVEQEEMALAESRYRRLNTQLSDYQLEIDRLKRKFDSNEKHSSSFHTSVEKVLRDNRAQLQNELRKKEADCDRMAIQIKNLEHQIENDQERIRRIQKNKNADDDHSYKFLRSQNADLMNKNTYLTNENIDLLSQMSTLQSELRESQHKNNRLDSKVQEKKAEIIDLIRDIEYLKNMNDKLREAQTLSSGDNHIYSESVKDLKSALSTCNKDLRKSRQENEEYFYKIDSLTSEIQKLKNENQSTELQSKRQQERIERLEDRLQQRISEIQKLKNQISSLECDNEKLSVTQKSTTTVDALQQQIEKLKNDLETEKYSSKQQQNGLFDKVRSNPDYGNVGGLHDKDWRNFEEDQSFLRKKLKVTQQSNRHLKDYINYLKNSYEQIYGD